MALASSGSLVDVESKELQQVSLYRKLDKCVLAPTPPLLPAMPGASQPMQAAAPALRSPAWASAAHLPPPPPPPPTCCRWHRLDVAPFLVLYALWAAWALETLWRGGEEKMMLVQLVTTGLLAVHVSPEAAAAYRLVAAQSWAAARPGNDVPCWRSSLCR